jgi:hypothetical protein
MSHNFEEAIHDALTMSASRNVEESTVTNRVSDDGTVFKRVEHFVMRAVFEDPYYRNCVAAYIVLVVLSYSMMAFNSGKRGLVGYKNECVEHGVAISYDDAWVAAKDGISESSWANFLESIVCPYTLVSSIMPYVVMYFNPINHVVTAVEKEE